MKEARQAAIEANSQARIELTEDSIFIYDQDGQLVNQARFADIVDLPMYQGYDAKGRRYWDRLIVTRNGEQIVLPEHGQNPQDFKRRIHQATNLKFSFRNNSTRHPQSVEYLGKP